MNHLSHELDKLNMLVPEAKEIFLRRYLLLKVIDTLGPIGRRNLALKCNLSERQVRNDADFLRDGEMVDFNSEGMMISSKGILMLENLENFAYHYNGFNHIKKMIIEKLGIKNVIIVETKNDDDSMALKYLGKAASRYLESTLMSGDTIGLTGGTSIFSLVKNLDIKKEAFSDLTIVPARGGLGRSTKYQANTLVEKMAKKLDADFYPLYTPDFLSKETIETLILEPNIKETIERINKIDYLVFGIGKANIMAKRRNLERNVFNRIMSAGAVGEAFGYYFNDSGQIVHEISTIGIDLEQFKQLKRLMAIAGGIDKAQAIISISKINNNLVLVTDIDCAREIINILGGKK